MWCLNLCKYWMICGGFTGHCRLLSRQLHITIDSVLFRLLAIIFKGHINCLWVMNNSARARVNFLSSWFQTNTLLKDGDASTNACSKINSNKHICSYGTRVFPLREQLADMLHLLQRRLELWCERVELNWYSTKKKMYFFHPMWVVVCWWKVSSF